MIIQIKKTETFIENDIIIDNVKIGELELNPDTKEICSFRIFEPYQNKGYGTKIIKDLVNQGYNTLWVKAENTRAIHVYEKCGFTSKKPVMYEMKIEV